MDTFDQLLKAELLEANGNPEEAEKVLNQLYNQVANRTVTQALLDFHDRHANVEKVSFFQERLKLIPEDNIFAY